MKVYVVTEHFYDTINHLKAFDNRKSAEEFIINYTNDDPYVNEDDLYLDIVELEVE